MTTAPRYSLVVPVYNEGENIAAFCRALAGVPPGYELLICHDFEGDDTLPALERLPPAERPFSVRPVLNTLGPGVRYASEAGMRAAAAPVVVVSMADVSDDFSRVEEMVAAAEAGADVVCASRYMAGGRQLGGPWLKSLMSRAAGVTLHYLSRSHEQLQGLQPRVPAADADRKPGWLRPRHGAHGEGALRRRAS